MQNRYPGAAVDVQSPLYSLSGNPYPWSRLFASQKEIEEYTSYVIDKYNLQQHIELNTNVEQCEWQQDKWSISTNNGGYSAQFVINATGALSTPVIPDFKGIDDYKGKVFHSNDWPQDLSLEGKRVAVIGSGASSVQIIPAIVDTVKQLFVFQRTPHWVVPRHDFQFSPFWQKFFAWKPIYLFVRWLIYCSLELRVIGFKYSKFFLNLLGTRAAKGHLNNQVKDEALREKLLPNFDLGCKRVIISSSYYPALQKQNCRLLDNEQGIESFTDTGITTKTGEHIELDAVVFATGYCPVDSLVSYPVVGKNGISLTSQWEPYPRVYLGTCMPNFPNFFVISGPNTAIGHTSAIFIIESQIKYIEQCLKALKNNNASSIEPTAEAEDKYTTSIHKSMENTVWQKGGCTSWYQNSAGKVIAMFPGFSFVFRNLCKRFKVDDHLFGKSEH